MPFPSPIDPVLLEVITKANDRCQALNDTLRARYPQAKLSFGYIGDVDRRGNDSRSFHFFTAIPASNGLLSEPRLRFGYASRDDLPQLAERAERELEAWLRQSLTAAHMLEDEPTVAQRPGIEELPNGRGGEVRHAEVAAEDEAPAPSRPR